MTINSERKPWQRRRRASSSTRSRSSSPENALDSALRWQVRDYEKKCTKRDDSRTRFWSNIRGSNHLGDIFLTCHRTNYNVLFY